MFGRATITLGIGPHSSLLLHDEWQYYFSVILSLLELDSNTGT